jgi:uncharacterized protein (TIGR02588 family)
VPRPAKNWLEWSVFAVGLVLVVGTLGFLVRESLVAAGRPPEVVTRLGPPKAAAGGYMVPVEVANLGKGTAEEVQVTIVLELPDGEREEAALDIAFLPGESRRNGWVTFRSDPGRGTLRLGPIAFEVP